VPVEPKPENTQRAKAVILVDPQPDRQAFPPTATDALARLGDEDHRARCEHSTGKLCQLARSAQHVAESEALGSGTAVPAGTPEVCTKNGKSQTELPVYLSPVQIARTMPGCPDPDTIYRWIKHGLLHQGRRVKLDAVRVGGRWQVTREAVQKFLSTINGGLRRPQAAAVAANYGAAAAIPAACNPREAQRRHKQAMARLRALCLAAEEPAQC
jgi:hypothetical protein